MSGCPPAIFSHYHIIALSFAVIVHGGLQLLLHHGAQLWRLEHGEARPVRQYLGNKVGRQSQPICEYRVRIMHHLML